MNLAEVPSPADCCGGAKEEDGAVENLRLVCDRQEVHESGAFLFRDLIQEGESLGLIRAPRNFDHEKGLCKFSTYATLVDPCQAITRAHC